jgi:hypothetical protein
MLNSNKSIVPLLSVKHHNMTFQISVVAGGRIKLYEAVIYKHTGMDTVHDLGSRSKVITPLDILLTASRISVISYTIKDIEQIEKVNEVTKMNLSEKPNLTKSASGKRY